MCGFVVTQGVPNFPNLETIANCLSIGRAAHFQRWTIDGRVYEFRAGRCICCRGI